MPIESQVEVAYLSPLTLQYIVAVDSNGSHSQLEAVTDYNIQFFSRESNMDFNNSDIEIVSNYVYQLAIPQASSVNTGTYIFNAG